MTKKVKKNPKANVIKRVLLLFSSLCTMVYNFILILIYFFKILLLKKCYIDNIFTIFTQ